MSADLMLTNKNKGIYFEGDKSKECVLIDETSMGVPWHDFGHMIRSYSSGFLRGETIDDKLIEKVKLWYKVLDHHEGADIDKIVEFLEKNKGEPLEYECW